MTKQHQLGQEGEQIAADFLREKGYRILAKNWRYQKAEVDLIAQKEDCLVVVEVKTRSSSFFGDPKDFLKPAQIQRLVMAVDAFIQERDLELSVRFDIISLVKEGHGMKITHFKDAFYHF